MFYYWITELLYRTHVNIRQERKAKARLDLPVNQQKLKRRSLEPEPVFGQLKHNHGYTRFRHFGKAKVTMDLGFVFMALNILKLHKNIQKSA
ncbi:transposase [Duncaniella muricolitica]|uniref:transposase n=1 Tax=Duncaniella muricolitica TaxID=2880704 RepID=UPI00244E50EB|nr:transposase [Duncaniella muricolitica]